MTPTPSQEQELQLFDPGPAEPAEIMTKTLERPLWTENKADLITRYLRYFVFITKHGTYIDAFAGPQSLVSEQSWTAQRILSSEPKRLRHFYLFDKSHEQVQRLRQLAADHSDRDVEVHEGDSNRVLPSVLPAGSIRETEATFCLLDQRTFQCDWQLCKHISSLRPGPRKVEQFYFLASWWMSRALSGIGTPEGEERVNAWLGSGNWQTLRELTPLERAETFANKFRNELGYRSVKPWPIYRKEDAAGGVMYYMIHATDHDEAPKLMYRAYCKAVDPPESNEQLHLALGGFTINEDTKQSS